MAIFPGNLVHGFASKLQHRVFLISWVKRRNGVSCCSKGRDYSSSIPVRYVPASKNEENGASSLPVRYLGKSHDELELNSLNLSRRVLDVDSKNRDAHRASGINYGLNLDVDEELKGDLKDLNDEYTEESDKIVEDSSGSCRGVQSVSSRQDVEKSAIELLASRSYTAMELKKKLQAKKFSLDIVDAVITDFQSRGLINDSLYAESYSRSRWSSSSWGPRRIKQALSKKGISQVDTENAIKQVFQNEDDGDQDAGIPMSKLSIDQLYAQASKQWQRSHGAPQDTRKSRMVRWLQYRGFNWSIISYVLKKLESQSQ